MTPAEKRLTQIRSEPPYATNQLEAADWAIHVKEKSMALKAAEIGLDATANEKKIRQLLPELLIYCNGFELALSFFTKVLFEALVRDGFANDPNLKASEALYLLEGLMATKDRPFELRPEDVAAAATPL